MNSKKKQELLSQLESKSNAPLVAVLTWTVVIAVLASCLLAKESAHEKKMQDFANYLGFATIFATSGVVLLWYQFRKLDSRLESMKSLLMEDKQDKDKDKDSSGDSSK